MIFKAKNTATGVSIENTPTGIQNITGQQTPSEGVVVIDKEASVYIPNTLDDFKSILDFLIELVPQISSASLYPNPEWTATSTQMVQKLTTIKEQLK